MEIGEMFCHKCLRREYGTGVDLFIADGTLQHHGLKPTMHRRGIKITCDKCGKKFFSLWRRVNLSE